MKKIGLCICYDTKNYGSMLQARATCEVVSLLGYDYEINRYTRKKTIGLFFRSIGRIPGEMKKWLLRRKKKKILNKYPEIKEGIARREECFESFITDYFNKVSLSCDTFSQLKTLSRKYDAVLVGSDQLWRPEGYSTGFYNLLFVPDEIPKISYATSFGTNDIPNNKKRAAKKFLNRFSAISVRELQGSQIVKQLTGKTVPTTLDPTLLFTSTEWKRNLKKVETKDRGKYIFCYFLGDNSEHRKQALKLKELTGYKIITIPHLDEVVEGDFSFGDEQLFNIDPVGFFYLIEGADYILTDSFHGTVFSILNRKKFITFNRYTEQSKNSRNSRIDSLFTLLKLQARLYNGQIENIFNEIEYNSVESRLDDFRDQSISYLKQALSSIKE